ncbi:MAG: protein kinase [Acidobacteriota bacterium]
MSPSGKIGRYEITGQLGRGGMGVVHSAHDPALDRAVAVKVLHFESESVLNSGPDMEARFLREARLAARLQHPSVATVYDAGREGDSLYLVMELVDGESLARKLQRGEFPEPEQSMRIVAAVADALAAAHKVGIVHRDVKPANILMAKNGGIKVSDFGIAKAVGESTELTRTGSVLGSPAYMAPEQVQGQEVDARADLFSLGVVLYELLLHRKPFPADTVTTLIYQILHQDPFADSATFRALGEDVGGFLRWTLAKNPADRIPDATTFAAKARALADRVPSAAELTAPTVILPTKLGSATATATAPVVPRRSRIGFWVAVAAALTAALTAAYWWGTRPPAIPPSVEVTRVATTPAPAGPVPPKVAAVPTPAPEPGSTPHVAEPAPAPLASVPSANRPQKVSRPVAVAPLEPRKEGASGGPEHVPAPKPEPPALAPAEVKPPPAYAPPVAVSKTFTCRKAAEFNVSPEESHVLIEGKDIGIADDWDGSGGGKDYPLAVGSYVSCFILQDYKTACVRLTMDPKAGDDVCDVDTELEKSK